MLATSLENGQECVSHCLTLLFKKKKVCGARALSDLRRPAPSSKHGT